MKIQPSMFLVTAAWGMTQVKSFKMIPLSSECPYIEVFFDQDNQRLVILSEKYKSHFTILPKLDQFGKSQFKADTPLMERHRIDAYKEFYITEPQEIVDFIRMTAMNAENFDFEQYIETAPETGVLQESDSTVELS